jgi:hypothetical protein
MLDPDISQVFTTPEPVNAVLRALIETMPRTPRNYGRKMGYDSTTVRQYYGIGCSCEQR